jgi:hypothetical protein
MLRTSGLECLCVTLPHSQSAVAPQNSHAGAAGSAKT